MTHLSLSTRLAAPFVLALALVTAAHADEAVIRKNLAERMPSLPKIDEVQRTNIAGLWEVRIGTDVLYTDAEGQYLIQGEIFDAKTKTNLTQTRIDKLTAIDFAKLPFADGVVVHHGRNRSRNVGLGDRLSIILWRADKPPDDQPPKRRRPTAFEGVIERWRIAARPPEQIKVFGQKVHLVGPAHIGLKRGHQQVDDIVGPTASHHQLPIEQATTISRKQVRVAQMRIAVQEGRRMFAVSALHLPRGTGGATPRRCGRPAWTASSRRACWRPG